MCVPLRRRPERLSLDTSKRNNGPAVLENKHAKLRTWVDSLRGSSVRNGTMQRILAWPLRKDDTHKSRSVNKLNNQQLRTRAWTCARAVKT